MRRGLVLIGLLVLCGASAAEAALVGLRQAITGDTSVVAAPGSSVELELYLDTGGLSFEGYYLGIDFSGAPVTIQSVVHQPLAGLSADLFGMPLIDDTADTIRRLNQFSFTTSLDPGEYVLDLITIEVGAIFDTTIMATPGLFGESLGLGGGACPDPGCMVSFSSLQIIAPVPEPGTALLLASGLLGLAVHRSKRRL